MQDKSGDSAMRAIDMLESMFEWLLLPPKANEEDVPVSPSSSKAEDSPVDRMGVRVLCEAYVTISCT